MTGYDKLKAAVEKDCREHCNCFNPQGCRFGSGEPARIGTPGSPDFAHCTHKYCDQFKWVIDRAKHYGEALNIPWEEILDAWEADRNYWYMNYYQESNQPAINSESVRVFDTLDELRASVGTKGFRCPCCGGISSDPYECNSGIVRDDGKVCDWKVYGLFRGLGKDVFVYCKDKLRGNRIFMPVAWEEADIHG